ncbi:MAG TPA: hypothetical protein PLP23_21280 [Panacibacter sp.]|nr:hypothetical protein [Panacibacter sp.]
MNKIIFLILIIAFTSCVSDKILVRKKINEQSGYIIKKGSFSGISYFHVEGETSYNSKFDMWIEFNEENIFFIRKTTYPDRKKYSTWHFVTDTLYSISANYQKYKNTFTPISETEMEIFKEVADLIKKNNWLYPMNTESVMNIKGWICLGTNKLP